MYQFSLDFYTELFKNSIKKSNTAEQLVERINNLNEHHTYAVYENICRGLFERHKLLFSFQICTKILITENKINENEFEFFLNGGIKPNEKQVKQLFTTKRPGMNNFYNMNDHCAKKYLYLFRLVTCNMLG